MQQKPIEAFPAQQTAIDRYWFLTWTTYGSWLPGDPRGCVTRVRDRCPGEPEPRRAEGVSPPSLSVSLPSPNDHTPLIRPPRREHDIPGTPYDRDIPGLQIARVPP